ncbi:MAG: hypothetical protein HZC42_00360 [Candidatus Eisenbacteria bacterium]|nr:hypothetical protein [Candidatus Eisenbacteria bacterium]
MTWEFDHVLKGHVAQAILHTALERVGYRVCRLGIEELLPELRSKAGDALRGGLPERLRFLPDFLVIDPETSEAYLVEVKFRSRLSEESIRLLCQEVIQRRQFWPETATVLMIAESEGSRGFHQDQIRVITSALGEKELLEERPLHARWDSLPQLQEVFRRIRGSFDNQQVVDAITQLLQDLAKIQRPRTIEESKRWESQL